MVRRYPELSVMETHPGGGLYDCLDLLIPDRYSSHASSISLNRVGSLHVHSRDTDTPSTRWETFWEDYLGAEDPRELVATVSRMAGLPDRPQLPQSTPAVLTFRFIAAFLSHALLGRTRWECRNSLGSEFTEQKYGPWFERFPAAADRVAVSLEGETDWFAPHRFWFVATDSEPKLCLETTGTVWDLEGTAYNLERLYANRRRIWPVVNFVARDLLP